MKVRSVFAILLFFITVWLPGCLPLTLEPLENPPPRERIVVDKYDEYGFIPANRKTLILDEQFTTNTRGWRQVTSSPDYTITSSGGEMYMLTRSTRQQNTISFPELQSTGNFEIEALVKLSNSSNYEGSSLIWGGNINARQWSFFEANDYSQALRSGRMGGIESNYRSYAYSRGAYNKFTVRKVASTCYYFINETYLGKEPFSPFYGAAIGFEAGFQTTMRVDYLKVSRLNI